LGTDFKFCIKFIGTTLFGEMPSLLDGQGWR